jgi:hypothetical protein
VDKQPAVFPMNGSWSSAPEMNLREVISPAAIAASPLIERQRLLKRFAMGPTSEQISR